jgi:tetratricopeptide (TPR) repeat protein
MADSHREEIAKLEALYANNPEGRVFTHLAEAYRKAGELQRAQEILQDGLTRHADYSSAHVVLGRVLVDMGETERARGAFRRVLELDRHNLIALRALGDLAEQAGDRQDALSFYRELLSLDPSDDRLRLTIVQLENEPPAPSATISLPEPAMEPIVESAAVAELDLPEMEEPTAEVALPTLNWEEEVDVGQEPLPGDLGVLASREPDEAEASEADILDLGWLPADAVEESGRAVVEEDEATEFVDFRAGPWAAQDEPGVADWGEPVSETEPVELAEGWRGERGETLTGSDEPAADGADLADEAHETEWLTSSEWARVSGISGETEEPQPVESGIEPALVSPAAEPEDLADDFVDQPEAVFTETIAELYTAQGLHERAAEVYRSLLRDHPEDAHLHERLRESEAALAAYSSSPITTPAVPASERQVFDATRAPESEEATWLEGVESAWTGGSGVAGAGPTPYAWTDTAQTEEAGDGTPISEYFRELLAWRPGSQAEVVAAEPEEYDTDLLLVDEVVESESIDEAEAFAPAAVDEPAPSDEGVSMDWTERPAEEAPAHELAAESAETTEEDEDLEMFRSWLQSLKR